MTRYHSPKSRSVATGLLTVCMVVPTSVLAAPPVKPIPRPVVAGKTIEPLEALTGRLAGARANLSSDSLLGTSLAAASPRASGTLASLGARKVEVAPGQMQALSAIAANVFADHDQFETELSRAGASAVYGAVERSTEVYEFDDAYVVVRSTGVVVADPDALRAKSPLFRNAVHNRKTKVDRSKLSKGSLAGLEAFKKQLARQPVDHPLRKAAKAGDQALLDAMADGAGDVSLVDTLHLPKRVPNIDAKGRLVAPKVVSGRVDYGKTRVLDTGRPARPWVKGLSPAAEGTRVLQEHLAIDRNDQVVAGRSNTTAEFVTGKTWADSWDWEHQWNVPSGFLRVHFGAHYAVGLRVPVEVGTRLDPTFVCDNGPTRETDTHEIEVRARARAVDGDAEFYRRAGMREAEVADGDEIALQAGVGYGYKLRLFWETLADKKYTEHGFDWGVDFDPPQGSRNQRVTEIFLPAELTKTSLSAGPLKGSARFGLRVDVQGEVHAQLRAFQGEVGLGPRHRPSGSSAIPGRGSKDKEERVVFASTDWKTWDYRLLKHLGAGGQAPSYEEPFGLEVSNVKYQSNWSVVPGVRVNASASYAGYSVGGTWTYWLDDARLPIGSLKLPRHQGTRRSVKDASGTKIWHLDGPSDTDYCRGRNQL
jgi:hypothetical protein